MGTAVRGNAKGGGDLSGEGQTGAVMTSRRPRERADVRFKGSERKNREGDWSSLEEESQLQIGKGCHANLLPHTPNNTKQGDELHWSWWLVRNSWDTYAFAQL